MKSKNHFFIITGIAGVGKSTLVAMLLKDPFFQPPLKHVITYTTRTARVYEKNGIDYHFITHQDFKNKIDNNFFIEYKHSHHYYGTSTQVIDDRNKGIHQIIVVDPLGAQSFKQLFAHAHVIVIKVGSNDQEALTITRNRMIKRGTENQRSLNDRLNCSYTYLSSSLLAEEYQVTNDNLEESYKVFKAIIHNLIHAH